MLQIRVDHGDDGGHAGQNALDTGPRQTAPPDTVDHAHIGLFTAQRAHFFGGAIRAVVIDKHDLPDDIAQRRFQQCHQRADILAFIKGRNHNCQIGDMTLDFRFCHVVIRCFGQLPVQIPELGPIGKEFLRFVRVVAGSRRFERRFNRVSKPPPTRL